jgi:Cytochrome P450
MFSVVAIPRLAVKYELLPGKYFIPKDTSLHFDTVNLQRNPKYWGPEIDVFNPSSFSGRNTSPSKTREKNNGEKDASVPEKIRMPSMLRYVLLVEMRLVW